MKKKRTLSQKTKKVISLFFPGLFFECFPDILWRNKTLLCEELLERLEKVYVDCGGIIIYSSKFDRESSGSGLDSFESKVMTANHKLTWIRNKVREFVEKRKKSNSEEVKELNEQINKFIRSLRKDKDQLRSIFKIDKESRYISFYDEEYHIGMSDEEKKKREGVIISIENKIVQYQQEVDRNIEQEKKLAKQQRDQDALSDDDEEESEKKSNMKNEQQLQKKKKNENKNKNENQKENEQQQQQQQEIEMKDLNESDDESDDDESDDEDEGYVLYVRLLKRKIKALRKEGEKKMDIILKNLEDQLDIAAGTEDKLKEGNKILFEELIPKTDAIAALQEKCQKKMSTAAKKATGQVKCVIISVCLVVLFLFLSLGVIAVAVAIATF